MKYVKRILASLLCLCLCMAYLPAAPLAFAETADVPTITLESVIAEPGDDVVIAVELTENPGLMAMIFEISYDPALLTLTGHEDAGLTEWDRTGDRILWLGEEDSSFNGTILKLHFRVADSADAGDIPVTLLCGSGDVGSHDEELYLPKITAGKVHIHGWGAPAYTWATDNSSVTAQRVCAVDAAHIETETVATVSQITKPATCLDAGETTWTAAFTNPVFTTQTKTEANIPATGHAYALTGWNWIGYTNANAIFTCQNDANHVQTVDATITSVRTEPTAEQDGSVVYTATVVFEGSTYTDSKTEILPSLGHDYQLSGWTWTGYTAAVATFTDKNGGASITVDALISSVRQEPTCETAGEVVYTATVTLGGSTYTDTKTEVLPPLGHDWGAPTYAWAEDNSSVTATRVCLRDSEHTETETVNTVSEITKPATCEGAGETTYTATFTNPAFESQTKTVENVPPIGHAYALTGWSWTGYTTASAIFTCANDASHVQTVEATITSVRNEPTAEENGSVVYTATVTFEGNAYTDTKTEILPATGHDYELIGWTWIGYSAASATFRDKNGGDDLTVEALISFVRTEPTCETDGEVVYTATVTLGEATYTDTKTETLPALGHAWGEPAYVWAEDNSTVTATRVCANDASHAETETVNTISEVIKEATTEEEGEVLYTAAFENPAFETQTKTVVTPKLEPPDDGLPCDGGDDCPGNVFTDMPPKGHWAHDAIDWAVVYGVTSGTSATTFSPDSSCTRAQVVTFLWRAAGKPEPTSTNNPFVDVKPDAYYYKAVLWAVEKGITNGTSPTTFKPDNTVTRAQFVTFLWRFKGSEVPVGVANPFTDIEAGTYFYNAVLWAVSNGVTTGTSATTFSPNGNCTRAQCVTFLYRGIKS